MSSIIVREAEFRRIWSAGHVTMMGDRRNAYNILMEKSAQKVDAWKTKKGNGKVTLKWIW